MNIRFGPVRKLPGNVTQMSAQIGGNVYQINQRIEAEEPCRERREEHMFIELMLQVYKKEVRRES